TIPSPSRIYTLSLHDALPISEWVAEHEPTADDLEKQRRESNAWDHRPKISLLIPLFDTPAEFLNQLFTSIVAQTYENWEACVVRSEEHTSELQSLAYLVCRLL